MKSYANKYGRSILAKYVSKDDLVITVGNKTERIIGLSRAFGKTTITYGDESNPIQKILKDNDTVVIDDKHRRKLATK
tara:strand:+ start:275 stop:508 length:234 start_codon:yes stop_codon:yes gene_type:complete